MVYGAYGWGIEVGLEQDWGIYLVHPIFNSDSKIYILISLKYSDAWPTDVSKLSVGAFSWLSWGLWVGKRDWGLAEPCTNCVAGTMHVSHKRKLLRKITFEKLIYCSFIREFVIS